MDKYLLALLCQYGTDDYTRETCQQVLKQTVRQFQIYQTVKEKERQLEGYAEEALTKEGFWALSTVIVSASTQKLILSGHNVAGIDSVNLRIGRNSEIGLTWSF